MSTATAEPDVSAELVIQQPERSVLFVSKRSELRLVHTGRYPIVVPNTGQRLGETRGVTIPFREHEFRCPLDGEAVFTDPGGAGEARMPATELLAFLEKHPRCGDPNEGFQRVDPKAPPIGQAEQQQLVDAATAWDVDTLRAIVDQERAGWDRKELIEVALGAIQKIDEAEARIRASEREHQASEAEQAASAAQKLKDAVARADAAEKALAAAEKKTGGK